MRIFILLSILAMVSPAQAKKSGSGALGKTLAICMTAVHGNTVQIRGDGNQVQVTVTNRGLVVGNMRAVRSVKGTVKANNLEIHYKAMNGFVNISCDSEPAGLIQINGTTDYLACNSGPDARAIQICNNRWSNAR